MAQPDFDEEILRIAVERMDVLEELAESPSHRKELQEALDISKTTCHRIVRTFDERGLLRRTDKGYTLSAKGELVAAQTTQYRGNMRAACLLEPIATAFEETPLTFDIELFADARITVPEPDNPTRPLTREFEIFRDSDTHLQADYNQFTPPLYLEQLADIIVERGMQFEQILSKEMIEERLSQFDELHRKQVRGEVEAKVSYRVCDGIPFGMTIYDRSHVVLRAYDDDTGSVVVMVDTDDPEAVAWSEEVYEHYREVSDSPDEHEDLPDWTPHPELDL